MISQKAIAMIATDKEVGGEITTNNMDIQRKFYLLVEKEEMKVTMKFYSDYDDVMSEIVKNNNPEDRFNDILYILDNFERTFARSRILAHSMTEEIKAFYANGLHTPNIENLNRTLRLDILSYCMDRIKGIDIELKKYETDNNK